MARLAQTFGVARESPMILRRIQLLRESNYENVEDVFPGIARADIFKLN